MSGPEHYRQAEQLLQLANGSADQGAMRDYWQEAQVHATLALAAATALSDPSPEGAGMPVPDWTAWTEAAATPRTGPQKVAR
jgi:hypothetical protein